MADCRVLVVEDDRFMSEILYDALEAEGYVVSLARTLAEGRALADSFAVAILDYDLNGEKVTPLAWELHEIGVPLILFTGVRPAVDELMPKGTRYVQKGGNLGQLFGAVTELCAGGPESV